MDNPHPNPSSLKASPPLLLGGNTIDRWQIDRLDGGGGRTRTCEAMRRLIYSQLPLPLGTLPRPCRRPNACGRQNRDRKPQRARGRACNAARLWAMRPPKVNQPHDDFDTPSSYRTIEAKLP